MRSLLITPGDDSAKLAEALASAAHAVVVDLDLAPDRRDAARVHAARVLAEAQQGLHAPALIVRLSPLDSGEIDRDLDAIMPAPPFAVILPRTHGAASVEQLSVKLALREALNANEDGATAIIATIDTAEGLISVANLRGSSARLIGLAWDADAFSADIGTEASRDSEGALFGPLRTARDATLIAAAAAGVSAIDTDFLDPTGDALRAEAVAARRAGFVAKLALNARDAAIINEAFVREKLGRRAP
jgi:citrate lyase subunit beta/citryl-CoA lyase